jgi:hypothetical protein
MADRMRGVTAPGMAAVLLLVTGCGSAAIPSSAQAESPSRITVSQYLRLQASAEEETESALMLGAYVAGLYAGIVQVNQAHSSRRLFCSPRGFDPELRDLLNFIDESLVEYRDGRRDADAMLVQEVLLDALIERFPCVRVLPHDT